MSTLKSRGFLLVINNPTEQDEISLKGDDWRYMVYQFERGDEEGTLHIQAFIYYENARVFPKKKYPRAHIEAARSVKAVMKYSMKEETRVSGPFEFGTPPSQGRRTDLEEAATLIRSGTKAVEIATDFPELYVRYHRGLSALENVHKDNRDKAPIVEWIWGKSGTGKTESVFMKHTDVYVKDGTQWWDGYTQNEAILIDDFDGKWPYRDLLRLLDRYPYQGQIKGGYVKINSPHIYITCEFPPDHYYGRNFDESLNENHLKQVTRRLTLITEKLYDPSYDD